MCINPKSDCLPSMSISISAYSDRAAMWELIHTYRNVHKDDVGME